jgi:hypothetical protein
MLLRVSIPVEAGNAAAKAGTLGSTIEGILADLKPEAAYFLADDSGNRSGSIVFDMKDTSQIPAVAEPWFLAFNAKVSLRPVMTAEDLGKAGPSIGKAVKIREVATTAIREGDDHSGHDCRCDHRILSGYAVTQEQSPPQRPRPAERLQ